MSDRSCAWITIGGRIHRSRVRRLLKAIGEAGASLAWGEGYFEPAAAAELLKCLKDGRVVLCDDQASYGMFPQLEDACRKLGLAFSRCSDAGAEYPAEQVDWRPGMKVPLTRLANTCNGVQILVPQADVRKALASLNDGNVERARRTLRKLCHTIPPVPPFEIV